MGNIQTSTRYEIQNICKVLIEPETETDIKRLYRTF